MFSNVINASMHCCMQSEGPVVDTATELPCHGDAEDHTVSIADSISPCECPECIQFNGLAEPSISIDITPSAVPAFGHISLVTAQLDGISPPPLDPFPKYFFRPLGAV